MLHLLFEWGVGGGSGSELFGGCGSENFINATNVEHSNTRQMSAKAS